MLETPEDETSPGNDGNSPEADPNSAKNAGGERNYCLKLGFGNISVKLLPDLSLLRAWCWFLPPACPDLSFPASPHPLSSPGPLCSGTKDEGFIVTYFFVFYFFCCTARLAGS